MFRKLHKNILIKWVNYLLIINFINLTANFYCGTYSNSTDSYYLDPIDTLAEIIVEFIFEMDDEIIPDTEVPNEKRKIKDIKLAYPEIETKTCIHASLVANDWINSHDYCVIGRSKEVCSPPPEV
ncbi:hypothetical protein ACFSKL_21555 [Belliella marina]|uniref:Uncharacterized protein n=1 Tax=Belliella marina TaxID=1644146 RepID=A0ABW4VRI0_9BACT